MDDRYTIDTPENIEFAYDIAGIGSRFLAAMIDTLLIGIAEMIIILIVGLTSSAIGLRAADCLLAALGGPEPWQARDWTAGGARRRPADHLYRLGNPQPDPDRRFPPGAVWHWC